MDPRLSGDRGTIASLASADVLRRQEASPAPVYVASLGCHELHLNGKRGGDHVLDPAQSDFGRRLHYVTHDVTGDIREGRNVVGLWLGRGWYWKGIRLVTQDKPAVLANLVIRYDDGSTQTVATDTSWLSGENPISSQGDVGNAGGAFGIECYDARKEQQGWDTESFAAASWRPATAVDVPPMELSAQMVQPNRTTEVLTPIEVTRLGPSDYLFDMGTNITGGFRLNLRGDPGRTVEFAYYASHLRVNPKPDENMGQTDRHVCSGGDGESFRTRFGYRAFQFERVSGLSCVPAIQDAEARLTHTDMPDVSSFDCSDEVMNRLYRITKHTFGCLTLGGIQVDCPHRERLGYGAEGQASMEQALCNFDAAAFYTKRARDFLDGQDSKTGMVHYTAPMWIHSGGGPARGGACIVFPWRTYLYYEDRRILEEHCDSMRHWIAFLDSKARDGLLEYFPIPPDMGQNMWNFLGDWASPRRGDDTLPCSGHWPTAEESGVFNSCYYYQSVSLVARIAAVLGEPDEADLYRKKAESIRGAINRTALDPERGRYTRGERQQTHLAYPLLLGIVPEEHREEVLENLVEDIVTTRDGHLDVGVLGSLYLIEELLKEGRSDLIYLMATRNTWPGWGNMLALGATTLWEHWLPGDSSIHGSFLSIGAWFLQGTGGIRLDESAPGFRRFAVDPAIIEGLTHASAWRTDGARMYLDVIVPSNTSASVHLPALSPGDVREGGEPATRVAGVAFVGMHRGKAVFSVGSGAYHFVSERRE